MLLRFYKLLHPALPILIGAALSIVFTILFKKHEDFFTDNSAFYVIALLVLFILLVVDVPACWNSLYTKLRPSKKPTVGIYTDIPWEKIKDQDLWTDITPDKWIKSLKKDAASLNMPIKVQGIKNTSLLGKYHVVINPYGGIYSEENPTSATTLGRIFDYVNNGGVFINVADVPGYYYFDTNTGLKRDSADVIYTNGIADIPFNSVPFVQNLGLSIEAYKGARKIDFKNENLMVERTMILNPEERYKPYTSLDSLQNSEYRCTPYSRVQYGDHSGFFILSMFKLISEPNRSRIKKDIISKTIMIARDRSNQKL